MPADLAALIAQRNARLRAWAAHGVPVVGRWRLDRYSDGEVACCLGISCAGCFPYDAALLDAQKLGPRIFPDHSLHNSRRPINKLLRTMRQIERRWVGSGGCAHLQPLAGEDPPGVVALTRLELLAGEPLR